MQINCIYKALPFIGFYITYQPLGYTTSLVTEVNHRYMLENLRPSTEEKILVIHFRASWTSVSRTIAINKRDCKKNNFIC